MYGSTIGTLNVTYEISPSDPVTSFTRTGNQGNTWIQGFVNIPEPYGDLTVGLFCVLCVSLQKLFLKT